MPKAATKKSSKPAAKKAAKKSSGYTGSTAAYNTPSSKKPQKYGGNQAIPLSERENGGRLS
jgi:hypothetical protein